MLEERLGQPVNIVNQAGANGTVATAEAARARPDGYTIVIDAVGVFTIQPLLREVQYSLDDFRGVSGISTEQILLVVNANSPWHTFEDLVEELQGTDRAITYGHSGSGALPHLSQAALLQAAGIQGRAVPFEGGGPAITALLGGHVDMAADHPPGVMQHVESGQLRVLGIMSSERFEQMPDVPTFREQGYDTGDFEVWKFVLVPSGTPDEVTQTLSDAFAWALSQPQWLELTERLNFTNLPIDGEEVVKRLRDQTGNYEDVVEQLGLRR
jgi:tripartite-type tricarboxylate transporter receptor subunit TctC